MPIHALDVFHENVTKMVQIMPFNTKIEDQTLNKNGSNYPIKHKIEDRTLKVAPKLCIFLHNAM